MLIIKDNAVIEEPMTMAVIIKAWGSGSTILIELSWIIGIFPSDKLPKFKNKSITAVWVIFRHTIDLIMFLLITKPYMPINTIINESNGLICQLSPSFINVEKIVTNPKATFIPIKRFNIIRNIFLKSIG